MTKTRMRLLWPLGPWPLLMPSILIVLVVVSGTSAMWDWPYQDWMATSSAFMTQLAVPGPIGAAAAAYYASRITGPKRIFALRPGGRAAGQVLRRHLTQLLAWLMGAYVLGLTPLLLLSLANAETGHLSAAVAATGLVGLAVFVLLGYAVGASIHSFSSVPIAFVASLAIVVLGTTASTVLSPVPSFPFAIGDVPAAALLSVRVIVMALLATACLALSRAMLTGSRKPPATTLLAVCAVVAFAVVVKHDQPDVRALDAEAPRVCTVTADIQACVHQGHRQQLSEVARTARPILDAYGHPPDGRWRVYDTALSGQTHPPRHVLWVGVAPENDEAETLPSDVVGQLIPIEACANRFGFQLPDKVEALYTYLQSWLSSGGTRSDGYDYPHFTRLSRTGVQAWIASHRQQLSTCTVDVRELPR